MKVLHGFLTFIRVARVFAMLPPLLSGCTTLHNVSQIEEVKPWQRGVLAGDDMQIVADPMQQIVDDHIYFSKEGSKGGSSLEGGGCGCN